VYSSFGSATIEDDGDAMAMLTRPASEMRLKFELRGEVLLKITSSVQPDSGDTMCLMKAMKEVEVAQSTLKKCDDAVKHGAPSRNSQDNENQRDTFMHTAMHVW
jgi:hypothetical protein